jgi:hypothetical protein
MKKLVLACLFLGVIGGISVGCGGNKCEALADAIVAKYDECGTMLATGTATGETTCTDAQAKQAECYTPCYSNLDCIVLKDPTNPDAADASKAFTDCLAACAK